MKRAVSLGIMLLALGFLLTGVSRRVASAATVSSWVQLRGPLYTLNPRDYQTDATGYLNLVDTVQVDPGATGLTYARVTSGSCDAFPDEAFVMEGQLSPQSDGAYIGFLYPVGTPAMSSTVHAGVFEIGAYNPLPPAGRALITGFVDGPPNTAFNVCVRQPGTYCVPYQGGLLCQAQYPTQGGTPTPTPPASNCQPLPGQPGASLCPSATSTASPVPTGGTSTPTSGCATVTYQPGWNLTGGPAGTAMTGAVLPMYTFQATDTNYEVVNNNSITAPEGFWTFFSSTATVTQPCVPGTSTAVTLPANHFIMVGNSFNRSAMLSASGAVFDTFNTSTNSYSTASGAVTLGVGQGVWVFSATGGSLTITSQ